MTDPGMWWVVVNAGGVALGVAGGAPRAWIGARVVEQADAPVPVRAAVTAVVAALRDPSQTAAAPVVVPATDASPAVAVVGAEGMSLRRTTTALLPLLRHALGALFEQAQATDVSLKLEPVGALPETVSLDPEKVGWAVAQLVGNAMRYVRRGTYTRPGGAVRVAVSHEPATDRVVIAVEDDGPGIPADRLPWLFARKGGAPSAVGLSLGMVRDVAEAHGGAVDVRSQVGDDAGTTITLRFPAR